MTVPPDADRDDAAAAPVASDPVDLPTIAQAAWGNFLKLVTPQGVGDLAAASPPAAGPNWALDAGNAGDRYDPGAGGSGLTLDGDDVKQLPVPGATPLQIDARTLLGDYGAGPQDALASQEFTADSHLQNHDFVGESAPPGSFEVAGDNAFLLNKQGLSNGPGPQGGNKSPGLQPDASPKSAPASPGLAEPGDGGIMNSDYRQLAQILGMGEGNYDSYNTGTSDVPGGHVGHSFVNAPPGAVTGMTINQILSTSALPGTDPNRRFAVGAYQITIPTLRDAASRLHLTGDELLTPQLQDRIFSDYLTRTAGGGVLADLLDHGVGTVDQAQYAAAKKWASVAVPSGYRTQRNVISDGSMSYFAGPANKANASETQALRTFLGKIARR